MSAHDVLIDASNLVGGGGVQVAASFLDEISKLCQRPESHQRFPWLESLTVEVSHAVGENLRPETTSRLGPSVVDRSPARSLFPSPTRDHLVAFTIFGPSYSGRRGHRQVAGCADVTSIMPRPAQLPRMSLAQAAKAGLRRSVSRRVFARADHLIVEADHVKKALIERWGMAASQISVVPNCLNDVVNNSALSSQPGRGWCYITRNYPHKNIDFLGHVGEALAAKGVHDVRFTLTLTQDEWNRLAPLTKRYCNNVGPVTIDRVSAIYAASEGAVFPSLLECFSVTPLEALAMRKPMIASDRDFVRDVCGDAVLYAEPDDAGGWADAILRLRDDKVIRARQVARGKALVDHWPSPRSRAERYLEIIEAQRQIALGA